MNITVFSRGDLNITVFSKVNKEYSVDLGRILQSHNPGIGSVQSLDLQD